MIDSSVSQFRLVDALRKLSANELQVLAEDVACIKFPDRFRTATLIRQGRNIENQTTKGWPDAFIPTGPNRVDGIEATRDKGSWTAHLQDDLSNAKDAGHYDLSGYFYVGGYPDHAPTAHEITDWVDKFAAIGINRSAITLLVGRDLIEELKAPEYARIRELLLGIPSVIPGFRLMIAGQFSDSRMGVFQPTRAEFEAGLVSAPALLDEVVTILTSSGCALVRGYGAAGKTTLAQLVTLHSKIAPSPVWYADFAQWPVGSATHPLSAGLVEGAGSSVVFVIDNVHLNETDAGALLEHWKMYAQPVGARLLLLGRETVTAEGSPLGSLRPLMLRAGRQEMLGVARRLFGRKNASVPTFSDEDLNGWSRTFGGTRSGIDVAVDLVSFSAALDRRLDNFLKGDFRLVPADAVDAVRERYLRRIVNGGERANLLRLAALSEYEIDLQDDLLDDPQASFAESINQLGIVLRSRIGLEKRNSYALIHPALGPLLLEAAADSSQKLALQINSASRNTAIGLRMLAQTEDRDTKRAIRCAIDESISSGTWLTPTLSPQELINVVRAANRIGALQPTKTDDLLVESGRLGEIVGRCRSIESLNAFIAGANKLRLRRSLALIAELATNAADTELMRTVYRSRPSEVATLVRAHPTGAEILSRIDGRRWSDAQAYVPAELASHLVSAIRYFDNSGRADLAHVPASVQIKAANPALWAHCDLGHVAHVLRLSICSTADRSNFLHAVTTRAWLAKIYDTGLIGPLCGALISLSNHLETDFRGLILTPELAQRILRDLARPFSDRAKDAARPICLLGGYQALGGQLPARPRLEWPTQKPLGWLLDGLRPKNDRGIIGMYELQFWLGLRELARLDIAPERVNAFYGDSFTSRLEATAPPTSFANLTKASLLDWLRNCRANDWRLTW